MAIQELKAGSGLITQPFQGYSNLTDSLVDASEENISFVNDGYSILVVQNNTGGNRVVKIQSEPDNAGREDDNLSDTGVTIATGDTEIFGPFRPIWWNEGGKVFITLDAVTMTRLAVFKLQF